MSNPTPSQVLREAMTAIETYGWVQHASGSTDDGFCILGAMGQVRRSRIEGTVCRQWPLMHEWDPIMDTLPVLLGIIRAQYPNRHSSVDGFNDAPGRTVTEVLTMMEKAAIQLEERGQ